MPGNRRTSLVGGFLLIALGLLFLYSNVRPGLDPWPLLSRYWPVLLVFLGLGKLWDQFGPQDSARRAWLSGREIAVILLLVIFGIALSFSTASRQVHDVETVDRQGSEPVRIHIQMPAGEMKLSGGASKLLEADFKYAESEGKPKISYQVSTLGGQLELTQAGRKFNIGHTENNWDLRLGNNIPMELSVDMGAGRSQVKAGDLSLTRLEIKMGAGEIIADLTGDSEKGSRRRRTGWRWACGHPAAGGRGRTGSCHGRHWFNQRGQAQTRGRRILQRFVWQVTGHSAA